MSDGLKVQTWGRDHCVGEGTYVLFTGCIYWLNIVMVVYWGYTLMLKKCLVILNIDIN